MNLVRRYAERLTHARRHLRTSEAYRLEAADIHRKAVQIDQRRLDAIKRVMEIDTDTIDVDLILTRAGEVGQ